MQNNKLRHPEAAAEAKIIGVSVKAFVFFGVLQDELRQLRFGLFRMPVVPVRRAVALFSATGSISSADGTFKEAVTGKFQTAAFFLPLSGSRALLNEDLCFNPPSILPSFLPSFQTDLLPAPSATASAFIPAALSAGLALVFM